MEAVTGTGEKKSCVFIAQISQQTCFCQTLRLLSASGGRLWLAYRGQYNPLLPRFSSCCSTPRCLLTLLVDSRVEKTTLILRVSTGPIRARAWDEMVRQAVLAISQDRTLQNRVYTNLLRRPHCNAHLQFSKWQLSPPVTSTPQYRGLCRPLSPVPSPRAHPD